MDGIKYPVSADKSIRLLLKNKYTLNVESGSTKTEIKRWIELFFGVKIIAMNNHQLPRKGKRKKMGSMKEQTRHYKRIIITLESGYYIPPFRTK